MSYTEHRYRSHDGLSLYYREYGNAERVLLCLPALTRNCKDFEDFAEQYASRFRLICPDFRGRGLSDRDPKPARYHPGTYTRDVWTLLDSLGISRVIVIGTSLGGLVAMIMAAQQMHRLTGVVLNDVGPELPPEAVARILQYVGRTPAVADWPAAARQAQASYGLAIPDLGPEFWLEFARRTYRETGSGMLAPDMDPAIGDTLRNAQGISRVLRRLRRLGLVRRVGGVPIDMWDAFRAVTMPCLLLRGALSDVLPTHLVARMQAAKPDLQVAEIPNRGHAPLLNEPEARAALEEFLARF
jgi:pimeloyl-ACP methyl ester carboxylesterase